MNNYLIRKTSLFYSLFVSIFIVFFFTQCSQEANESKEIALKLEDISLPANGSVASTDAVAATKDESSAQTPSPIPTASTSNSDLSIERKLMKEGNLKWETSNISKTHASIIVQAKKYDAYISNDNQSRNDYEVSTYIELRIPSDKFDDFVNTIEKDVPKFDEKKIKVMDVTEEFIDVSTRIKTKKELEQHYLDLLKQTKNVSEVLQVEQQLNIVRTEIESAEGRLKYLNDRISMSTLHLTFYETTSAPVGFFGEIGKSFAEGWKGFLFFVLGIIRVWPILLIIATILLFLIKRRKK